MTTTMPPNGPVIGKYEIRRLWRSVRPFAAYNLETDQYVTQGKGQAPWGVASFEAAVRCVCRWQGLAPKLSDIEYLRNKLPPFHGN